ncbi:glycosyltransferase family 61 protein [Neobacillus drentensis]|uniref:glycosyltransferase family 61 protein n=1 Tax=Neobacillus drentensis TaxID=220684 RepID=UPI002FFF0F31
MNEFIFSEKSNMNYFKEIYPPTEVPKHIKEFKLGPNAYIGMLSQLDNWWNPAYFEKAYVAVLEEARVVGERGAIISNDNKIIHDYSFERVWQKPEEHTLFQKEKLFPISRNVNNAAILTHTFIYNYYHWLIDTIPRIHLLEQSGLNIEKYIVNSPNEHELLNLFGIPSDKIIVPDEKTHLSIKNLIIPSQYYVTPKWACDFIRNKFLPPNTNFEKGNKKIYITRNGAGTSNRKILNEDVIFNYLKNDGFERYELEKISIADKAKLFAQADFVIAPTGAGLTNLVFCNPGTKVIEIFPSNFLNPHYYLISQLYNLDYHHIIETPVGTSDWAGFHDIIVDESRFFEFYRKLT